MDNPTFYAHEMVTRNIGPPGLSNGQQNLGPVFPPQINLPLI